MSSPSVSRTAADLAQPIRLSKPAQALLNPDMKPGDFLRQLGEKGLHADAIRFMAQAMRPRDLVWWVCLCTRHTASEPMSPTESAALQAAVHWVLEPGDAQRMAAKSAAAAAGSRTPSGCAAQAAFLAGGASPIRFAKTAAAGIFLAAARGQRAQMARNYRQFLALGLDVDFGQARWPEKAKA